MEEVQDQTYTNQFCKTHKRTRLCYARLSPNSQNPLMCSTCQIQNTNSGPLLSIDEILNASNSEPITNWPPGIDSNSLEFLRCKETFVLKDRMRKGIQNFYDKLKQMINKILLDSEKQQLSELDNIKLGSEEVIEFYNQSFKRNELNEIFKNHKFFDKERYLSLLNALHEVSENNFVELSEKIKTMRETEVKFRVFQEERIDDILDGIIKQINDTSKQLFSSLIKGKGETGEMQEEEEDQSAKFEEYSCKEYCSPREKEDYLRTSKNILNEMQTKLNQCQSRSLFNFCMNSEIEITYLDDYHFIIKNPSRNDQLLETQYSIDFKDEISFMMKFDSLESLESFRLGVIISDEIFQILDKLITDIHEYLTSHSELPIQFSVLIKNSNVELKTEGFCQSEDISELQKEDTAYYLQLYIENVFEQVEIFDYKYSFAA